MSTFIRHVATKKLDPSVEFSLCALIRPPGSQIFAKSESKAKDPKDISSHPAIPCSSHIILMLFRVPLTNMATFFALTSGCRQSASTSKSTRPGPLGCDTFVAYPPASPVGTVIFGKNSDRPRGEGQSIRRYPAAEHDLHQSPTLPCTYIDIPQVKRTYAVLLSQIDWMYGAEMGANEHGVVIGNEAVWTKVGIDSEDRALLGMDLVRLGLERGKTSREALDVITNLLETHGQGGPCAENDPSFTYHNSFLICDIDEGWILETAGKQWAAKRIDSGRHNISNGLSIRTSFDLCSDDLKSSAIENKFWSGQGDFDFARIYSSDSVLDDEDDSSRLMCGAALMRKYNDGDLDQSAMMGVLRDHTGGICMHGGFETTASMVSELSKDGNGATKSRHWMTGKSHPCKSTFHLQDDL